MSNKDVALVVPTIREQNMLDFIERWGEIGLFDNVDLYVMEDNPKKSFSLPDRVATEHYDWDTIRSTLQKDEWIIPRRSDTVRSFMYYAVWLTGKYNYIMTLDDDCYPTVPEEDHLSYDGKGFVDAHIKYLTKRSKWHNTLINASPRGLPYFNRGVNDNVILNHGLWTKNPDWDAPHQLAGLQSPTYAYDNVIVPNSLYFPFCGMNAMWKSEYTVWMYHLLMGNIIDKSDKLEKLPFDRFGDIWCGIIFKKLADAYCRNVSTGLPYIRHERASNPFANLKKEANGIEVNERFWKIVEDCSTMFCIDGKSYVQAYKCISKFLCSNLCGVQKYFPQYEDYFEKLGEAMIIWSELFENCLV